MSGIKSPVSWIGNKTPILHILYATFPLQYRQYIEPFGGSGSVLLGKPWRDTFEVYNDYNKNLVNLFRCMRDRPLALIRELGFLDLNARDDFNITKQILAEEDFKDEFFEEEMELTRLMFPEPQAAELREIMREVRQDHDLRRAAMFLKLIRRSYASTGKSFACRPFSIRSLYKPIMQFSRRSRSLFIENQDFEALIKHFDNEDAFFYCDPPYFSSEYVYDCEFSWEDHVRLRDTLMGIKGKFLLSYNDCREVRELYEGCSFLDFTRRHTMVQRYEVGKEFPELLVANYDIYERERAKPRQLTLFGAPTEDDKTLKERIIQQ